MTVDTSARDIDPVPDDATIDATNERLGELAGHLNAVNAALVDETFALLATGATGPPPTPTVSHQPPLAGRFDWNWIGLGWVHPNAQQRRIERARQVAPPRRHAA